MPANSAIAASEVCSRTKLAVYFQHRNTGSLLTRFYASFLEQEENTTLCELIQEMPTATTVFSLQPELAEGVEISITCGQKPFGNKP